MSTQIEFQKLIIKLAAFYEKDLTDSQIRMFAEYLQDRIPFDLAIIAVKEYIDDAKNEYFPRPMSKLVALAKPPADDDMESREASSRIISAVKRFGWPNANEARQYIGELGWRVVELQGGWTAVCESMSDKLIPTLQAQYRDLAKSQISRTKQGFNDAPALPEPITPRTLQIVSNAFEVKKDET